MTAADDLASFLELAGGNADAGVLNDRAMIALNCDVYRCRAAHRVVDTPAGRMGVPMFAVERPLIGKKIVSMPFYFYPKLVGVQDWRTAVACMMDAARKLGPSAGVVARTDSGLPPDFVQEFGIQTVINSIESRVQLGADAQAQRDRYQKRLAEKIGKARRDIDQSGSKVEVFAGLGAARKFYEILTRQYRDKHRMLPQPWELFRRLFSSEMTRGFVKGYALFRGDRMLAGMVVLGDSQEWKYCWGATSDSCDVRNASAVLIDRSISDAVAAGATLYNMGSSSPTDENLLSFKSHWGSTETPIFSYHWNCAARKIDLNADFQFPRWVIHHSPLFAVERAAKVLVPWLV
jgi:hypothetical protein